MGCFFKVGWGRSPNPTNSHYSLYFNPNHFSVLAVGVFPCDFPSTWMDIALLLSAALKPSCEDSLVIGIDGLFVTMWLHRHERCHERLKLFVCHVAAVLVWRCKYTTFFTNSKRKSAEKNYYNIIIIFYSHFFMVKNLYIIIFHGLLAVLFWCLFDT